MKPKTIIITGGHLTPAIATIEELQRRRTDVRIVFIGRTHATEAHKDLSHEKDEMDRLRIPFISISTGRIQRFVSFHSIVSLLKIPVGIVQALVICIREQPSCIVSFGGYVALPVVLSGWLLGIQSITHEQTSVLGLANRIIARFATKICVTFPEMLQTISKNKGIYTGLPLRSILLDIERTSKGKCSVKRPVLYITGGTTGATSVNSMIFPILDVLTTSYDVIHQTGRVSFDDALQYKTSLPKEKQERYHVYQYVDSNSLRDILDRSTLVIGRSGANTTIEVATLGIPAIFIPLPWSGGGEQQKNAQWLSKNGAATVLYQSNTTSEILLRTIQDMLGHITDMNIQAQKLASTMPRDGASRFTDVIVSHI